MEDTRFILEVEEYCELFENFKILNESDIDTSNVAILIEAKGHILLSYKNKPIDLYYRDKYDGHSGKMNVVMVHGNSIKIKAPKDYFGLSIEVPKSEDDKVKITDKNDKEVIDKKIYRDLKPAIDFVKDNARYLNAFYNSDSQKVKERALKQIKSHNDNIKNMYVTGIDNQDKINKIIGSERKKK